MIQRHIPQASALYLADHTVQEESGTQRDTNTAQTSVRGKPRDRNRESKKDEEEDEGEDERAGKWLARHHGTHSYL